MTVSGLLPGAVFGPVHSRRFGLSLGINPLPPHRKVCTFDCPYCECGRTPHPFSEERDGGRLDWPDPDRILGDVEAGLERCRIEGAPIDSLTFAGNGEPTLHPDFPLLLEGLLQVRSKISPRTQLVVLTNGTRLHRPEVNEALQRVDEACFKLDAGNAATQRSINRPPSDFSIDAYVETLSRFPDPVIQTLFVKGGIDTTRRAEVDSWIARLIRIRPRRVDLYSLDRPAPDLSLQRVSASDLEAIAERVRSRADFPVRVF